MGFPTSPTHGDEYTTALGTVYKYSNITPDFDDKWYIISSPLNIVDDTTPQLGGPLDLNDKQITHELVAAVSLVAGDLCYMNGSGKMAKADASAEATCDTLLVMCLDTISADATGTFLIFGKWTTSGLTAGAEYWVSETAAAITTTRPTTVGSITRHVGTAVSTTVLFFNPSHTYVEYV